MISYADVLQGCRTALEASTDWTVIVLTNGGAPPTLPAQRSAVLIRWAGAVESLVDVGSGLDNAQAMWQVTATVTVGVIQRPGIEMDGLGETQQVRDALCRSRPNGVQPNDPNFESVVVSSVDPMRTPEEVSGRAYTEIVAEYRYYRGV